MRLQGLIQIDDNFNKEDLTKLKVINITFTDTNAPSVISNLGLIPEVKYFETLFFKVLEELKLEENDLVAITSTSLKELIFNITKATFRKNSTLDWHKHSTPQVLIVVDGEGYYQERGKDAIIIKKGDIIRCAKDTEHWHTASKENLITYLALYDGSKPTVWTEQLTQEYYDSIAKKLSAEKK